jgi:adenylate cyclase
MGDPDRSQIKAQEYYALGLWLHGLMTPKSNRHAREMFNQAVKIDKNFARAYGHLSYAQLIAWLHGWNDENLDPEIPISIAAMSANAQRAFGIDKDDYYNSWSQAVALVYGYSSNLDLDQLNGGLVEFDRAVSLAKEQASSFNVYDLQVERADALFFAGRDGLPDVQKAISDTLDAITNSPRNTPWFLWTLGWAYYEMGFYENEKDNIGLSLNTLLQFKNPPDLIRKNIMADYVVLGAVEPARKMAADFIKRNPLYTLDQENRFPYRDSGRLLRWKRHLKTAGLPGEAIVPPGR